MSEPNRPWRPWEVHGTTEYTPEMLEALKKMAPMIQASTVPAGPVTVTLPADWRLELKSEVTSAARDKPWLGGETAVEMVESWAAPKCDCQQADFEAQQLGYCEESVRASADPEDGEQCSNLRAAGSVFCSLHTPASESVRQQHECDATLVDEYHKAYATIAKRTAERDKLSDSLKLAIAAADRRQARIDSALALVEQYLTGHWPNSGVRALFLAALSNDPAARVPVDPETTQPAARARIHDRCKHGVLPICCGICAGVYPEPIGPAGATQDAQA